MWAKVTSVVQTCTMYIDPWQLEKKDNLKIGIGNLVDILVDEHKIGNDVWKLCVFR